MKGAPEPRCGLHQEPPVPSPSPPREPGPFRRRRKILPELGRDFPARGVRLAWRRSPDPKSDSTADSYLFPRSSGTLARRLLPFALGDRGFRGVDPLKGTGGVHLRPSHDAIARQRHGTPGTSRLPSILLQLGAAGLALLLGLGALPRTGRATLETIDFEEFAEGHILESDGDLAGVTFQIAGTRGKPKALIVFDSDCHELGGLDPCTGGDFDLRTPGGGHGNDRHQRNIVIFANDVVDLNGDGRVDDPDDSTVGGKLTFFFEQPVKLVGVTLIDVEDPRTKVQVERVQGNSHVFRPADFGDLGDNNAIRLDLSTSGVSRKLEIELRESGGVDDLVFELACGNGV
ncbi:MAG: hypothetical protein ACYTJ0_10655, partial [Planctomycetota bacterium]